MLGVGAELQLYDYGLQVPHLAGRGQGGGLGRRAVGRGLPGAWPLEAQALIN